MINLSGLEKVLNEASLAEAKTSGFKFIDINKIQLNELNNGRQNEENIDLIKNSIAESGLINALVVYPNGDFYKLISGHGRLKALQELNEYQFQGKVYSNEMVPVFIDKTNRSVDELALCLLKANAQKDETLDEKLERVKLACEIYTNYRQEGKINTEDKITKRAWIAQATGYSQSSVRDYLTKIFKPENQQKVEKTLDPILYNIDTLQKLRTKIKECSKILLKQDFQNQNLEKYLLEVREIDSAIKEFKEIFDEQFKNLNYR